MQAVVEVFAVTGRDEVENLSKTFAKFNIAAWAVRLFRFPCVINGARSEIGGETGKSKEKTVIGLASAETFSKTQFIIDGKLMEIKWILGTLFK